jgi:AcrR family transcriptional regulator
MDHLQMTSPNSTAAATRKRKTRTALRTAMLELLAENPFDQILITDLTNQANVGYATFFRHYDSTEELLNEIAGDQIRDLLEMSIPVMRQYDSSVSTRALCQYVFERRSLWRTLLTGGAAHTVRGEFVRQAREWSRKFGDARTEIPLDLGTICSAGSTIDALAWWLDRTDDYTVDEIAAFIDQLIITPFIGDG